MTIKQARKILGKDAKGITDRQIEEDIKVAELFKNLFFSKVTKSGKKIASGTVHSNVP